MPLTVPRASIFLPLKATPSIESPSSSSELEAPQEMVNKVLKLLVLMILTVESIDPEARRELSELRSRQRTGPLCP